MSFKRELDLELEEYKKGIKGEIHWDCKAIADEEDEEEAEEAQKKEDDEFFDMVGEEAQRQESMTMR